jgi:hypothetical protein
MDPDPHQSDMQDPDPHQCDKQNPHQSDMQDPDPHESDKQDPFPHQGDADTQHLKEGTLRFTNVPQILGIFVWYSTGTRVPYFIYI